MDRRSSRNDYAPTWEDNEISLIPADDVSPSSYTDSQAAGIPMPTVKKDKRPSQQAFEPQETASGDHQA
jgi:hypothetical protein